MDEQTVKELMDRMGRLERQNRGFRRAGLAVVALAVLGVGGAWTQATGPTMRADLVTVKHDGTGSSVTMQAFPNAAVVRLTGAGSGSIEIGVRSNGQPYLSGTDKNGKNVPLQ
jgi:hypothetical protein